MQYILGIIMQVLHGSIFYNQVCESLEFLLPLKFLHDDNRDKRDKRG